MAFATAVLQLPGVVSRCIRMAHQDNVWKALHYMPPTPQKSRVEQVGGELKSYPSVHKGTMPAPPPIEDRPRAANYPVHLRPQEVSDYSPLRLDPLQHSPSLVQAASLDLPVGEGPWCFGSAASYLFHSLIGGDVEQGAVHRPYLDPLPLAANGGNSAKELISMIQSRLMALEGRASTIEETASQV